MGEGISSSTGLSGCSAAAEWGELWACLIWYYWFGTTGESGLGALLFLNKPSTLFNALLKRGSLLDRVIGGFRFVCGGDDL